VALGAAVSVAAVSDGMPGYYQWQAHTHAADLVLGTKHHHRLVPGDPVNAASTSNALTQTVRWPRTPPTCPPASAITTRPRHRDSPITFTASVYGDYSGRRPDGRCSSTTTAWRWGLPCRSPAVSDGMPGYYQWQATLTAADLVLGTKHHHRLVPGRSRQRASTSNALTQTVQLASTSTYLSSTSGYYDPTSAPGQTVTFTANISGDYAGAALTGAVQFYDNGVALGAAVSVAAVSERHARLLPMAGLLHYRRPGLGHEHHHGFVLGDPSSPRSPPTPVTRRCNWRPRPPTCLPAPTTTTRLGAGTTVGRSRPDVYRQLQRPP